MDEVTRGLAIAIEEGLNELSSHFKIGKRQARVFMDPVLTGMTKRFHLDIIKLDDWLHTQGYKEEIHGSMEDYITLTYGQDACTFVDELFKSKEGD